MGEQRWLVSCKHTAQANKAVSINDEQDIITRLWKFDANGFIAFYSMVPSSELSRTLESLKLKYNVEVYDSERIERSLLGNRALKELFKRFFPNSYTANVNTFVEPKNITESTLRLNGAVCGADLFIKKNGIIGICSKNTEDTWKIEDIYWSCRGKCDSIMEERYFKRGMITGWESIDDLMIPLVFMERIITWMNSLKGGKDISDLAHEKFTEFMLAVAQLVVRETSPEENERISVLRDIPFFLGGLSQWGTKFNHLTQS